MKTNSISLNERILLFVILGIGCFLRFYKLTFESFWLDELHTAIEADPSVSWKELFGYLNSSDQHPPLFFVATKFIFYLFGNNEFTARLLPATAGTIGIWIVYLLGRELYSNRLGLVASTLTCFNYFHILYSQEARPYAFAFLFSGLSFLFLIRLIKNPNRKNSLFYALFTLLMLGSHYFGLFTLASQIVIGAIFWIKQKENRKPFLVYFVLSGVIIFIGFSPWLPFLFSMAAIKSFWIQPVQPGFAIDFFYEYFGNSDLIKPLLFLFLIAAFIPLILPRNESNEKHIESTYSFGLVVCILWVGITLFIPYLRSVVVVPTLFPRYTIVILPAFILILSFGIEFISNSMIKYILLISFCILSLTDLILVKNQYSQIHKTQFREMAKYIASDSIYQFPFLCEVTAWHQQYYLKKFGFTSAILGGKKEALIDSIFESGDTKYKKGGFWIGDAHGGPKPTAELQKKINEGCILLKKQDFYDAWAQLYIIRDTTNKNNIFLDYRAFSASQHFIQDADTLVAVWDKLAISNPVPIKKGKYIVNMMFKGDPALKVYPHLIILINEQRIGICNTTAGFENYSFFFECKADSNPVIRIVMDNDLVSKETKEDRNAFLKSIFLLKTGD